MVEVLSDFSRSMSPAVATACTMVEARTCAFDVDKTVLSIFGIMMFRWKNAIRNSDVA